MAQGAISTKRVNLQGMGITLLLVGALSLASCTTDKKAEPTSASAAHETGAGGTKVSRFVSTQTGVAGGVAEETYTASVKVFAVDSASRTVTLMAADGRTVTFKAGPEIRNFDQIRAGDNVKATITDRIVTFVRPDGADLSVTHSAAMTTAPSGEKPGMLAANIFEVVASVISVDPNTRTATLQFVGGQTDTVQIRPDVDLSEYKVGNNVVIRVTETLRLLVENP
jgi:hypothetical protein